MINENQFKIYKLLLFIIIIFLFIGSCKKDEQVIDLSEIILETTMPSVTSIEVTDITRTSVLLRGKIISNGGVPIISCGVVWSTKENPSINENIGMSSDSLEDGLFTSIIDDLKPSQTYYIRAYATNSEGTGYGDILTFTTFGSWMRKADFGGTPRYEATGFSIGDMGYIGTGLRKLNSYVFYGDVWQYNQEMNVWTRLPGLLDERAGAISFSLNNKVYIGLGYYFSVLFAIYTDFWSFNPDNSVWTEESDLDATFYPGFYFSVDDKGYVGFCDSSHGNFWEYNATENIWIQKTDFPGLYSLGSACFTIQNKAYVCTGQKPSELSYGNELWEYDPVSNIWTQKSNFGGVPRADAVGFSIGNKGYILTGWDGNNFLNDCWEYNPYTDSWKKLEDFIGSPRGYAVGFAIGNKGYIGTGENNEGALKDFWEFDPNIKQN